MSQDSAMRKAHRQLSMLFTLLVIANFAAMAFGTPPAWLTYAPLLPLLFMMISGLIMYFQIYAANRRAGSRHA